MAGDPPLLRWAIVGTGDVAESMAHDIALVAGAELAAVVSRELGRGQQFADRHAGPAVFDDLDTMFDESDAEIVYIATPHATHLDLASRALTAGKHVLVEKPAVLDAAQARQLVDVARSSDRFLMEAMWMKFQPAVRGALAAIRSGAIGEPRSVRASFGMRFPADRGSRWSAEMGGSALLDQGIYPVTLAEAVLGDPDEVSASMSWFAPGVDATQVITFGYDDGRFAQLASSMVESMDLSASINGVEGWIELTPPFWATDSFAIHRPTSREALFTGERHTFETEGFGYVPMIREVAATVRAGGREDSSHPLGDTVRIFELLDRIRQVASADR